jgi:hypothetical protein
VQVLAIIAPNSHGYPAWVSWYLGIFEDAQEIVCKSKKKPTYDADALREDGTPSLGELAKAIAALERRSGVIRLNRNYSTTSPSA